MKSLALTQTSQDPETSNLTNQIAIFIYNTIGDNYFQLLLSNTLSDCERGIFIQGTRIMKIMRKACNMPTYWHRILSPQANPHHLNSRQIWRVPNPPITTRIRINTLTTSIDSEQ